MTQGRLNESVERLYISFVPIESLTIFLLLWSYRNRCGSVMFFNKEFGVYHQSRTPTKIKMVLRHHDWCIMRHGDYELRVAWISPFGMIFSNTGLRFPKSSLVMVVQGDTVSAELSDFLFMSCTCPVVDVAAQTVARRLKRYLPSWRPHITTNSLYGATGTGKIKGAGVTLAPDWSLLTERTIPVNPSDISPLPHCEAFAPFPWRLPVTGDRQDISHPQ